jgi:hypothetical protein
MLCRVATQMLKRQKQASDAYNRTKNYILPLTILQK